MPRRPSAGAIGLLILALVPTAPARAAKPVAAPRAMSLPDSQAPPVPVIPKINAPTTTEAPAVRRCARDFIYRGKREPCDSLVEQDGERLRPILGSSPDAIEALDTYQSGRRKLRSAAYVGTAGLALALIGILASSSLKRSDESTADLIYQVGVYGGASIAIGSVLVGASIKRQNEDHLGRAIDLYNQQARPEDAIQLEFSTGFMF